MNWRTRHSAVAPLAATLVVVAMVFLFSCGESGNDVAPQDPPMHPYGLYAPGTLEELNPAIGQIIIDGLGLNDISEYQDYTIGLINNLEISWIRIDFIYSAQGFFIPSDYLVKLNSKGVSIAGTIRPVIDLRLDDLSVFQEDVRDLVRNNPSITEWQIDNEPNFGDKYTPDEYIQVFFATRSAVKDLCPSCRIILAGSAIPFDGDTRDRLYFDQVFAGISSRGPEETPFDAIDLHFYGKAGDYIAMNAVLQGYKDLLVKNGFGEDNIGLWMTECATYTDSPSWPPDYPTQTEGEQASELLKRFVVMLGVGTERVAWSRFYENHMYGRRENGYYDNTGLIYNGIGAEARAGVLPGTKKEAFTAYSMLVAETDGYTQVVNLSPGQYKFVFSDGREPVYVLWFENEGVIPPELDGNVLVVDHMGNEQLTSNLELGNMPVFVRKR